MLDASVLYAGLVERLWHDGVPVRYASHITGHGLRKIMRADRELTYRIDRFPEVPEVLEFLVAYSGLGAGEAYATFNMGAGLRGVHRPGVGRRRRCRRPARRATRRSSPAASRRARARSCSSRSG